MARLVFPDDQLVFHILTDTGALGGRSGLVVTIYTDAAGTIPADLQDMANNAIANSQLTVDSHSLLPYFQGPNDGSTTLYAKTDDGAVQQIFARDYDRITANANQFKYGSGVPNIAGTAGQYYFRTDTPGTAGQRIYACTVTGNPATWVATGA